MKKSIVFIVVLMTMLMIPISVNADAAGTGIKTDNFEYSGTEQYLELENIPDGVDIEDISWTVTPNGLPPYTVTGSSVSIGTDVVSGQYSVSYDADESILTGSYEITARPITIKPVDITREFSGQTIKADSLEFLFGSLIGGHKIDVSYSGSLSKIGDASSNITNVIITDGSGNIVTDNYSVTKQPGKLILTEPFAVIVDPEPEGSLAGPSTANPAALASSGSGSANSASAGTQTNSNTDNINDTENIADGRVPLDSGITTITDNPPPLANEANNILGTVLFFAGFLLVALAVIYLIARRRNKIKEDVYY